MFLDKGSQSLGDNWINSLAILGLARQESTDGSLLLVAYPLDESTNNRCSKPAVILLLNVSRDFGGAIVSRFDGFPNHVDGA
jgi:hypothetical protein